MLVGDRLDGEHEPVDGQHVHRGPFADPFARGDRLPLLGRDPDQAAFGAEEWQAVTAGARIREGAPVHVLSIDGLVLTVEAISDEHAPAGQRAPVSEGGNPA